MSKSKSTPVAKRVGFFAQLPAATVREIKRRAKANGTSEWRVVAAAFASK